MPRFSPTRVVLDKFFGTRSSMGCVVVLAATLIGLSSLYGETAPTYPVTVREVKITPASDNGAPGMKEDAFFVKFEAALRNTSDRAIFVSAEPLISAIPEILLPSEEWKPMFLSADVFETGNEKYPPCTKVAPGKTFTFPNLREWIVLRRDRPANQTVRVRFHFYNLCMMCPPHRP